MQKKQVRGLIGYKFRLSPLHKKTDICDTLAGQNKYGLGAGVYPAIDCGILEKPG